MITHKTKTLLIKTLSLFSVVRGYNIAVLVVAQYLSAVFILAPEKKPLEVLLDWRLFIIVFVSTLTVASGYIINNFYDSEKDWINRPTKSMLDTLVSQNTKLQVYFVLNLIATALALLLSTRAVLFFTVYIFLLWFYSHKLKKHPIIGNVTATFLVVLPFFAILLYFKNYYPVIFAHGGFVFLLLLIREMIKDLENIKGDVANNYQTVAVRFGEKTSKQIITLLTIFTIIPVYILIEKSDIGYMDAYFYASFLVLLYFLFKLWSSESQIQYLQLHNILKILIVLGVFCLCLINPMVVIELLKSIPFLSNQ